MHITWNKPNAIFRVPHEGGKPVSQTVSLRELTPMESMAMTEPRKFDPLTEHIVRRIDPKVRDSLTPSQFDAVVHAIGDKDRENYLIDVRRGIPLFLSRFYVVFLVCRDRRVSTRRAEESRGKRISWTGGMLFVLLMALPFLLVLFFFLYLLKLMFGWDVFPEFHLWDVFR